MRRIGRIAMVAALGASLAACGGKSDQVAPDPSATVDAASPPDNPIFAGAPDSAAQCKVCHSFEPGRNGVGPSLAGIAGRKAGTEAGFAYSPAMKASGLTWDDATLDTYLTAPMKAVPGTKMAYAGMPDAAKRKALIDWLKTVK